MAVFDVMDYGAAGDGETDDTGAVQAALDAAGAEGGGVVYVPAGDYRLTSALTVHSHLSVSGDGDQVSVLRQTRAAAGGLRGTDVNFVEVSDLQLSGPGRESGGAPGIRLTRDAEPDLYGIALGSLYIREFGGAGVFLDRPIVSTFRHVICEANGAHGFSLRNGGASCELAACCAVANAGSGYHLDQMVYCHFSACAADSNRIGYELADVSAISFGGCGAEDSSAGWKIDGGRGVTLAGCHVRRNTGRGFWVTGGAEGVTMISCVEDATAAGAATSFQVDAGCRAVLIGTAQDAPVSLAPGAATVV